MKKFYGGLFLLALLALPTFLFSSLRAEDDKKAIEERVRKLVDEFDGADENRFWTTVQLISKSGSSAEAALQTCAKNENATIQTGCGTSLAAVGSWEAGLEVVEKVLKESDDLLARLYAGQSLVYFANLGSNERRAKLETVVSELLKKESDGDINISLAEALWICNPEKSADAKKVLDKYRSNNGDFYRFAACMVYVRRGEWKAVEEDIKPLMEEPSMRGAMLRAVRDCDELEKEFADLPQADPALAKQIKELSNKIIQMQDRVTDLRNRLTDHKGQPSDPNQPVPESK